MQLPPIDLTMPLTLFEYESCSDPGHAALLFEHRDSLQPYLSTGWLMRSFEGDRSCLRATHYVGILPFFIDGAPQVLLIAPKGCHRDPALGLVRFLELVALGDSEARVHEENGWQGQFGPYPFLLFLASHYAHVLRNLCQRDFRSYYRSEEGELRGHIRGRLHFASYVRAAYRGKAHVLPCCWEEFTVDNWDNRILWGAARRLQQVAAGLDARAAASVSRLFRPLLSWFGAVAEVPINTVDLRKSRLARTSKYYHGALKWARLLLQGSGLPSACGQIPPLVLNANEAFERFAEVIAKSAIADHRWNTTFQQSLPFLTGLQIQTHRPDIIISSPRGTEAVADAKYKEVLERGEGERLENGEAVVRACVRSADWNQLYAYMRMTHAPCGFFVVPFWSKDGPLCDLLEPFSFVVPPSDGNVRVAVLGLNLLQPVRDVRQAAGGRLRQWLSENR